MTLTAEQLMTMTPEELEQYEQGRAALAATGTGGRRPADIGDELFQIRSDEPPTMAESYLRRELSPGNIGRSVAQVAAAPLRVAASMAQVIPLAGLIAGTAFQPNQAQPMDDDRGTAQNTGADAAAFQLPHTGELVEIPMGPRPNRLQRASAKSLQSLQGLTQRLTFVDEGLSDTALSLLMGGGAGAGMRAWMERTRYPMALLARQAGVAEPLLVTGVKSGLVAAAGDKLIIDPALFLIENKVAKSDLSPRTKELAMTIAPLVLGVASGASFEARLDKMLGNPLALRWLDDMARRDLQADEIIRKWKAEVEPDLWGSSALDDANRILNIKKNLRTLQRSRADRLRKQKQRLRAKEQAEKQAAREDAALARSVPEPRTSVPLPGAPKNPRTIRGRIKQLGGIAWGQSFTGERRDMPLAVKYLSRKTGTPWDVLEQTLKAEGWMADGEVMLDLLREDGTNFLRRNKPGTVDVETKREAELTGQERRLLQEGIEYEVETPPPGRYEWVAGEDLPDGELTIIEGRSREGWDVYRVVDRDPFGVTLQDGRELTLAPGERVQLMTAAGEDAAAASLGDLRPGGGETDIRARAGQAIEPAPREPGEDDELAMDTDLLRRKKEVAGDQAFNLFSMAPGALAGLEVVEDDDGNKYLGFTPWKAAMGLAAGAAGAKVAQRIGIETPTAGGRYLRGSAKTRYLAKKDGDTWRVFNEAGDKIGAERFVSERAAADYIARLHPPTGRALTATLTDDALVPSWDGVDTLEDAHRVAASMQYLGPVVVDDLPKRHQRRYNEPRYRDPETGAVGNEKMRYPNRAYPQGRDTLDFRGCGREAWARINGVTGSHPLGYTADRACYGGACYAEADAIRRGPGSTVAGNRRVIPVAGAKRRQIAAQIDEGGMEYAREMNPGVIIAAPGALGNEKGRAFRAFTVVDDSGRGAKVTTRLENLKGRDIRLGVDTDGAAWLSDKRVLDALLKADPGTVSVFASGYHRPPPPHELSRRTIVNVTVSGFHPLPETLSRLRWAAEARANGWNVVLREVTADPGVFTAAEGQLYNRIHDALHATDFTIMQQPLHRGKAMGGPIGSEHYPACCVGTPANPRTCDLCETAEGLGHGFQRWWGVYEEPGTSERILPDVPRYSGLAARTTAVAPEASRFKTVTTVGKMKAHPKWDAAKHRGDVAAAADLVEDLVGGSRVDIVTVAGERWGKGVIYAPVVAVEAGDNAIPQALAELLAAKTGAGVMSQAGPVQTTSTQHTGAGMTPRMLRRAEFGGEVVPGAKYVLVDDVITSGGTLADMAAYIKSAGGEVVGAVGLTNASRKNSLTIDSQRAATIRGKYGTAVKELFGVEAEALTPVEADHVERFRSAESLRAGVSAAKIRGAHLVPAGEVSQAQLRAWLASPAAVDAARKTPARPAPGGSTTLYTPPQIGAGLLTGTLAGLDQEALKDGEVRLDMRKVIAGIAAGVAAPRAYRVLQTGMRTWSDDWSKRFIIEPIRKTVDGLIWHEELRAALGMGRSRKFQDRLRDYHRQVERVWEKAAEIGTESMQIAPSKIEQRRLMQIIRGGTTTSKVLAAYARRVNELFDDLRQELKNFELMEYSRFDDLTKAERKRLRDVIYGRTPASEADIAFAKSRLEEYYHWGSAYEYAPIYYNVHEGLTPKQRRQIEDEITRLKRLSRKGRPEGRDDLEGMVAELEGLLEKGLRGRRALRTMRTEINQGYAHRRQELPPEVAKMMGRIEEAAYPVAKGLGTQAQDVARARLFRDIANNADWARGIDWWDAQGTRPNANWVKVTDDKYGALKGKFVRRDVWSDLRETVEWRNDFVKKWDKMMSLWKAGKVVWNPATHVRNSLSNMILAYFGDVSPLDVGTYTKAAKAVVRGVDDPHFKAAKEWGLFTNSWASVEVKKLRDGVDQLRDAGSVKGWMRDVMSIPSRLYQGNEHLFKMAIYIKAREAGMSVDAAARKAQKYLFDYGDIPPWVRHAKRWVAPFLTFTYKAVPLYAEMAIRKPWKVAMIAGALYGMERYARDKIGMTEDERQDMRQMGPDWQRKRLPVGALPLSFLPPAVTGVIPEWAAPYSQVLMPFRDKWGNPLTLDLSYILPYGNLAERWGQSPLPLADIMPNSPMFQLAAEWLTNTDSFTGREIIMRHVQRGTKEIAFQYLTHAWREAAPSLAPGGHGFNKLMTGIQNTYGGKDVRDWADRPIELQTAVLSTLLGIKLTPAGREEMMRHELRVREDIRRQIGRAKGQVKSKVRRNEISRSEGMDELRRLNNLERQLMQDRRRK